MNKRARRRAARSILQVGFVGLLVSFSAHPAQAADTWTSPFPGVTVLHRTGPKKLNLYAAVVDLCQAGVSVRHTAFAERGQKTSSFAKKVGAQVAINGDFSCRPIDVDPKKSPFKPCIGKPKYMTYGIAAHAGQPWPGSPFFDALLAFGQERAQIWDNAEDKPFDPKWMQEVISGHWSLVLNGKLTQADCPIDPRTSIGLSKDGNKLMFVVVDGRKGWRGMTCKEVGAVLIALGADRGFNLDGGGSSTFWQQGKGVRNHPSDGVERVVGPHLAIFAKGAGPAPHCEPPSVFHPKAPLPSYQPQGKQGWLSPVGPVRVFDTRQSATAKPLKGLKTDAKGRVAAGTTVSWASTKWLPKGTVAAVMNLTAVDPAGAGFISAWSGQGATPNISVLNYRAGQVDANLALVGVGATGVSMYTHAAVHLIGDLQARFAATGAGFVPVAPYRALDTRPSKQPLQPQKSRKVFTVPKGAEAVVLGVTAVSPAQSGFLAVYPCGGTTPNVSNLNYVQGQTRANVVVVPKGGGTICVTSSAQSHLVVDVFGTFQSKGGGPWQGIAPRRLIDTRKTTGRWTGKVRPDKVMKLRFGDMPGFPKGATGVTLNVTAVRPRADGYVALSPCGVAPKTSTLNFRENQTIATAAWMAIDGDEALCLTASARTHVVIDINGVFTAPPKPPKPLPDAGSSDAGTTDAGGAVSDAGMKDSGATADTKLSDDGQLDTNVKDSQPTDAGLQDSAVTDSGAKDAALPADVWTSDSQRAIDSAIHGDATAASDDVETTDRDVNDVSGLGDVQVSDSPDNGVPALDIRQPTSSTSADVQGRDAGCSAATRSPLSSLPFWFVTLCLSTLVCYRRRTN